MNYFKMFKDVGIIDSGPDFLKMSSFDNDNNCQKASDSLFKLIDENTDNDFKPDLIDFIFELKNFYIEVGFNLGQLFIERHFNKEFSINFCDKNKIEMKNILNLNVYLDAIFNRMWDIRVKNDFENLFHDMQNKIAIMKRKLILESSVTEEAINFVLNSDELSKLSYFLIKTVFKCGVFICLVFKILHMLLSEEPGYYLPGD